ncbi:MAG: hypothetical protein U5J64_07840 [Halobacteriales archaeon]|nr:hypothetical protein [Halobacteriales archaeon]
MSRELLLVLLVLSVTFSGCIDIDPDRSKLKCIQYSVNDTPVQSNDWFLKESWIRENVSSWDELSEQEKEDLISKLRANWSYTERVYGYNTLNASLEERNESEIIDRVLRLYKEDLNTVGRMDRYSKLTEENKAIFRETLRNETDIYHAGEQHENSADVSESEMRSFLGGHLYGDRGVVYQNNIYGCINIAPRGTA